jgi:tRNA-dihydrouridine synthase B
MDWVRDTLLGHLEALYAFYGEHLGVRIARKHLAWYSKSQPGGTEFRRQINQTESVAVQRQMIRRLFDQNNNDKGLAA